MFQSISLGLANVAETDFEKKLLLAKRHGFSAVESSAQEVMENGTENVRALLEKHGMQISGSNLPFHPAQVDDAGFEAAMEALPAQAAALSAVGCMRCIIWIFPGSDTLTKEENYALHKARLSRAAAVLAQYGIRLGLEFIGPYTGRKTRNTPLSTRRRRCSASQRTAARTSACCSTRTTGTLAQITGMFSTTSPTSAASSAST